MIGIDDQVRELVTELTSSLSDPVSRVTLVKGTVTAWDATGTPPSVTINLSGDTTDIPGVRYQGGYSPVVGDTVDIMKQGTALMVIGRKHDGGTDAENGWINPVASIWYRRIVSNGSLKLEFKGSGFASGTALFTLPATPVNYRPSAQRVLTVAFGTNAASRLIFNTNGTVVLQQALAITDTENGVNQTSDPAPTGANSDPHLLSGNANNGVTGHQHEIGHRHWMTDHFHGLPLELGNTIWFDGLSIYL
jgi:hypothetical protein